MHSNKSDRDAHLAGSSSSSSSLDADYTVIASAKRTAVSRDGNAGDAKKRHRGTSPTDTSASNETKLAPLFLRGSAKSRSSVSSLVWKPSLGPDKTCLRGEVGDPFASAISQRKGAGNNDLIKVACFDLDGCLIKPKAGKTWPSSSDPYDFEAAFRGTLTRVKEEYERGAVVVIVTNQDQSRFKNPNSARLTTWKQKMAHVAEIIDCPLLVLAAISVDGFRKPGRLMWDIGIVESCKEAGGSADLVQDCLGHKNAFFVGDAAGRAGDHSDTDRKWAINVGMPFYTPEEFFLGQKAKPYQLSGWKPVIDVSVDNAEALPSQFFEDDGKVDLVLFVGPPASGKTSFFEEYFATRGYEHVNQDKLKTASKCLSKARELLQAGRSIVVDNTNRNASTRAPYIKLAKELGEDVRVRCVYFKVTQELCNHNNYFRVRSGLQKEEEARSLLPGIAISSFFNSVEDPKREEGFDSDVAEVQWRFRGSEEARRRWLLQWN